MTLEAKTRKDDGKIVIMTNAYVSHRKGHGPWSSTFAITLDEAADLVGRLNVLIDEMLEVEEPVEVFDPTDPSSRIYENEIVK